MTGYFPQFTIVGVVGDNKTHGLDRDPYPLLYWSMDQLPSSEGWLMVRSRRAVDPTSSMTKYGAMVDRGMRLNSMLVSLHYWLDALASETLA